jgi:flagellar hook assembly protein FlgD
MDVFTQDAGGSIRVGYTLMEPGPVRLDVYDAAGRLLKTLESSVMDAGRHYCEWDCRTQDGIRVNAGVYFIKMSYRHETLVKKTMVVR